MSADETQAQLAIVNQRFGENPGRPAVVAADERLEPREVEIDRAQTPSVLVDGPALVHFAGVGGEHVPLARHELDAAGANADGAARDDRETRGIVRMRRV